MECKITNFIQIFRPFVEILGYFLIFAWDSLLSTSGFQRREDHSLDKEIMNNFKKYNLIVGWLCFAIAAIVYLSTIEPTASFWDCSEFIATSYKMEVGHPPGAPLFMMIARFFTLFGGPHQAAMLVNAMSALASAATILFLFWSITHLGRRAYRKNESELSWTESLAILGAGVVGALAYTFTDTFWFSAVEGEVYALSSMFTAVVFWAILKWENIADEPHANRWLVLIAYLTGLAIGVHLLNLLIIPSIVLIYYFKKYPNVTKWGITKAVAVAGAILVAVMFIIIPRTVQIGAFIDRVFVNSFGLPINIGITVYAFLLLILLGWGVYYTHKKGKVLANTIVLCLGVIVLGYGSYASVIIRSSVNPPMNSNSPNNPYGLLSLLNRDQYGARPLVKGNYYSSPAIAVNEREVFYVGDDGKYKSAETVAGYEYAPGFEFFFPRMYSSKESDIQAYQNWVEVQGRQIPFHDEMITVPTFGENMKFFFGYQLNFMYWRYFLWNFVGRQSDIQSTGEITDGNWLSGINAVDEIFLGPQDNLPSEIAANKGRNTYFFLPFILGIIGLIFQLNRDGKNFAVVLTLFIMTGVAIAVYLNSPPAEPRERDYVYAGSFYVYAIWIGFGVLSIFEAIGKWLKKRNHTTAIAATAVCMVVPVILAAQNWDDHDRSHRFVARDFGNNYLISTQPNSIVINFGDNDTFPLWYAQEVEGTRKDVRVMNMSYLSGEWYIDQMKIKSNDSEPLPFSIPRRKYTYVNEFMLIKDLFNKPIPIKDAIDFIISDDERTKISFNNKPVDFIPSKQLQIPVNKENVLKSGIVKAEDADLILDTLTITINKSSVDRGEMMLLDLLANFNWERPIYFTQQYGVAGLGLKDYLQADGFVYQLVPIKTPGNRILETGRIDSEKLYKLLMEDYRFGNIKDPRVYADFFIHTNFNSTHSRNLFARLAKQLTAEGDTTRAIQVLDRGVEEIPFSQIRHSYVLTMPVIEAYYDARATEKANAVLSDYQRILEEKISYYMRFNGRHGDLVRNQLKDNIALLYELYNIAKHYNQVEKATEIEKFFVSQGLMDA